MESNMTQQYRKLNTSERQLIDRLLSEDFPGRDAIRAQLLTSLVRELDVEGSLEFAVTPTYPPVLSKFRIPVEGSFVDRDGVQAHILLHIVNKVITELEVYKEDGSPIIEMPQPEQLTVFRPE